MVGIIILNYNSAQDTIKCVASIEEFTQVPYRIYIVDGASKDNSYIKLSEHFKSYSKIEIIKSDINGGYSYGNNLGINRAIQDGADTLLIINPDVYLLNNAIDTMYNGLSAEKDVAVVGPRIFGPHKEDMQFASKLYTFKGFLSSKKPVASFTKKYIFKNRFHQYSNENDYCFFGMVSGCCFMIKADIFESIGFFDTNVFLYHEEDIIAYKLAQHSKKTKILSCAMVLHHHSATVSKEGTAFSRFHRFYSAQYVLKKYAKVNNFQFLIVSLYHLIPFTLNAVFHNSYRKLYLNFLIKTKALLTIK